MHSSDKPISVSALVPYPVGTTPSQRFRIEQWQPVLEEKGITVELRPFADEQLMRLLQQPGKRVAQITAMTAALARQWADMIGILRADVVLVHRAICLAGPAMWERLLALVGRPLIFDFDDAIFLLNTNDVNRRFGWLKFPGKTATICRLSTHVVVGNSYLADYARQYNQQVSVIPTSLDTEHYRPRRKDGAAGRIVVGWTGSATSQTHLELFAPVLRQLLARRNFELRVISNRRPVLPGLPHVWRPWSSQTEVEELAHFDIGIMPIPDDQWARGKCALKALQCMAMGIPTICSAVGANLDVIQQGENGLLAATPEEWLQHLETLIDNPALRAQLGAAGRRTVEQRYSMRHCADAFARVVREVATGQHADAARRDRALTQTTDD